MGPGVDEDLNYILELGKNLNTIDQLKLKNSKINHADYLKENNKNKNIIN